MNAGRRVQALEPLRRELESLDGLAVSRDAELARLTTFRIGGTADLLVEAHNEAALVALLRTVERHRVPLVLLGIGSNVLVPDEGVRGVVVRLAGEFGSMRFEGTTVVAGGALALPKLARASIARGLVGLEALAGFPSSVGGAVRMNAGCYGSEIKDVLRSVRVVDRLGRVDTLAVEDLEASYRTTRLQQSGQIVMRASFELTRGDSEAAARRAAELDEKRRHSLPWGEPSAGSIFRNPPGDSAGRLIDRCGLKGMTQGGAQISPRHGNVIVNVGGARGEDVLALMAQARHAVAERFAVRLEPEIVLLGSLAARWRRLVEAADAETGSRVAPASPE
jgi:UDP-N-acetylmuramate dehydrogenase